MTKIVVVNVEALGHVNSTLPVVEELVARGAELLYFAPRELGPRIEATGARFSGFDSIHPFDAAARDDFPGWLGGLMAEARQVLPQIAETARAFAPDLVAYDMTCIAGRVLRAHLGTPGVMFFPSHAENERFSLLGEVGSAADSHPALVQATVDAAEIARDFGVRAPSLKDLFGGACEGLNIAFIPRAFQLKNELFDERFAFVGASIGRKRADARPWSPPPGDGPLLFVALGTTSRAPWPEFFQMCVEAFRDSPRRVVMAIGKRVTRQELGELPANITAVEYAPQLEVLQQASVFISHGGINSTTEALYFGVPLMVVPQMGEQAATGHRVAELGLGYTFQPRDITATLLRETVDRIAGDEAMQARMRGMQEEARAAGGRERAASLILEQAARRSANG